MMRPSSMLPEKLAWRCRKLEERIAAIPGTARCRSLCEGYELPGGARRIYFYHIRKTAGISLSSAFMSLETEDGPAALQRLADRGGRLILNDKVFVAWNWHLIEQGLYYYAFSHMPNHRFRLPENTYTITCLRDPVARIISDYKMVKGNDDADTSGAVRSRFGRRLDSLRDYVRGARREDLLRQVYMFSKRLDVNEAADGIQSCDFYFFTERFTEGVAELSERLQMPLRVWKANKARVEVDVAEDEIAELREIVAPEYQLIERLENVPESVAA